MTRRERKRVLERRTTYVPAKGSIGWPGHFRQSRFVHPEGRVLHRGAWPGGHVPHRGRRDRLGERTGDQPHGRRGLLARELQETSLLRCRTNVRRLPVRLSV